MKYDWIKRVVKLNTIPLLTSTLRLYQQYNNLIIIICFYYRSYLNSHRFLIASKRRWYAFLIL